MSLQPEKPAWLTESFFQNELKVLLLEANLDKNLLTQNRLQMLYLYVKELCLWNSRMNLVGPFGDDFIARHILDSLAPLPYFLKARNKQSILAGDVGSGGGLPSIPLAIFIDDIEWKLIERSTKKCGFLRNCCAILGFGNRVKVLNQTIEEVQKKFDWLILRAFRQFEDFYPFLNKRLKSGGQIFAYKGKKSVVEKELQNGEVKNNLINIFPIIVPNLNEERNLLVLSKN